MRTKVTVVGSAMAIIALAAGVHAAGAAEPDVPTVVEQDVVRTYTSDPSGVRSDPWVVWVCALDPGGPVPERVPMTAASVAARLEAEVAPWFEWASQGAYQPVFTPGGTLAAGTNDYGDSHCLKEALQSPVSAGFAGAVIIVDAPDEVAHGDSGHKTACASPPCTGSTVLPTNGRSLEIGAHDLFTTLRFGAPFLSETVHELGHTLDWGHASPALAYRTQAEDQPGFTDSLDPDAAWIDAMFDGWTTMFDAIAVDSGDLPLGEARAALGGAPVSCTLPAPPVGTGTICLLSLLLEYGDITDVMATTPSPMTSTTSAIPQTQVFNRYAAGWVPDEAVAVHDGGYAEYDLAPIDVDGVQMLVLPSAEPLRFVTLEARRPSPFLTTDELLPGADDIGVLVHLVDQVPGACGPVASDPSKPDCWGDVGWKTSSVGSTPWTFGDVLVPGSIASVDGVQIKVVSSNADGSFTVAVGDPPATTTTTVPPSAPAVAVVTTPSLTG